MTITKQAAKVNYRHILDRYVERRNSPRFPFTAEIEGFDPQANIRMTGRLSEISRLGCYVDTISPFAKNATVRMTVTKDNRTFRAQANIAYSTTGAGMGLAFTTIEPDQLPVLEAWLEALKGSAPDPQPSPSLPAPDAASAAPTESTNRDTLRETVGELITLLTRKSVVSDSERAALLQKLSR